MELSLKIVSVDSHLAKPIAEFDPIYSSFSTTGISYVPILRIFGITPTGAKGCVHIHGVFPYFYVPIPEDETNVDGFKHYFAKHLNDAITLSMEGNKASENQHVYKITVVRGIPFYGYSTQSVNFFKIYLYRPYLVKKCAAILQNGLCGRKFQPHESHVPFTQQFFLDFNLYGMSSINLKKYVERQSIAQSNGILKATRCVFEADAIADDILNNVEISGSLDVKNPGLAYIWQDERIRRRDEGTTSQISLVQYENVNVTFKSKMEEDLLLQMKEALKARTSRNSVDSSNLELSSPLINDPNTTYPLLDSQDLQLLEGLAGEWVDNEESSEVFEEDSILGSQRPDELDDSLESILDHDLTLPFNVSDSDESDENSVVNEPIDTTVRYSESSSEGSPDIIFVDGAVDDLSDSSSSVKSTPPKAKKRSKPLTPNRYNPLGIKIQKSPLKKCSVSNDSETSEQSINAASFYKMREASSSFVYRNLPIEDKNKGSTKVDNLSNSEAHHLQSNSCGSKSAKKCLAFENVQESQDYSEKVPLVEEKQNEPFNSTLVSWESSNNSVKNGDKCLTLSIGPPLPKDVLENLNQFGLGAVQRKLPFYGSPEDLPTSKEIGFVRLSVKSKFARDLEEHSPVLGRGLEDMHKVILKNIAGGGATTVDAVDNALQTLSSARSVVLVPLIDPPASDVAAKWFAGVKTSKNKIEEELAPKSRFTVEETEEVVLAKLSQSQSSAMMESQMTVSSQSGDSQPLQQSRVLKESGSISGLSPMINARRASCLIDEATANNSGAFKMDFQNLQEATKASMYTFLTLCAVELHVNTRSSLKPNPEYDAVEAIFYTITNDVPTDSVLPSHLNGFILVQPGPPLRFPSLENAHQIDCVNSEKDLFMRFISFLHYHDPDILVGYEIEMSSWGYLIQRGYVIGLNLCNELSRVLETQNFKTNMDKFKLREFDIKIGGRILLNVWRMMRHEVSLMSYTFENMAYHILHTRVPHYSHQTLTLWWNHLSSTKRILTVKYYCTRVTGVVKLLDTLNLIGRTSEMASLFGIQFFEVLSRGSQFRVESMMLRLAKQLNYVPVSPSVQQRAEMRAPACLPLIMEPESRFYSDPVIVLDFQSLYPSMMIAYNYCFSTCLGRVDEIVNYDRFKFGCTDLTIDPAEMRKMKDHIHISPAGVAFVDSSIRRGVLPCMLDEILETRLMVKKSMKTHKSDKILHRVLDARQLGLKLIANVTYGYTSANFSGRMPCIEVGDSVVSKGRETLERSIRLVKETSRWGAQVVYGDTDSLFVLCPGRTKEEAFAIGQEISDAVTNSNPRPVKLKLEKVYQPCILQTKKRYVGYMYESPDQKTPVFEAKGIETVRRDGCIAVAKILEKSLRILFETYDISQVKKYVCDQLMKISSSTLSLQDLIFAREYRGMRGYKPNACVPALQLVKEWLAKDPRAEPRAGERVGYCIVYGPPGVPLIRLVRDPRDVMLDPNSHLNADYYVTKVILPPLQRCFTLLGVDVFSWLKSMPKIKKSRKRLLTNQIQKATLSQYFATVNCIVCSDPSTTAVCSKCQNDRQLVAATILPKIGRLERKEFLLNKVCMSCCGRADDLLCDSTDCPIFYRKCLGKLASQELDFISAAATEFL